MSTEIVFENGKPTYEGSVIVKCFKDNGNGLLFRIVNSDEKSWAFYNDTQHYYMFVRATFGKDSEIEPLGKTTFERDTETGEFKCETVINPTETEMFIRGLPNGFKLAFEANPNPPSGK